jgi:hypothetical protein
MAEILHLLSLYLVPWRTQVPFAVHLALGITSVNDSSQNYLACNRFTSGDRPIVYSHHLPFHRDRSRLT